MKRVIAALLMSTTACFPASALGKVRFTFSPKRPYVDDDLTVSFRGQPRLRSNWHWVVAVSVKGSHTDCADSAYKQSSSRKAKVTVRVTSNDDILQPSSLWCVGKANIVLMKERNGDDDQISLKRVAYGPEFRFYRQP